MKYKTKSIIKKVALALAGIVAVSAVGVGVAKLVEYMQDDLKTISPSFDVGNLGADGKYVNDESTLYTKEAFQCDGLQIKLDFDNEIDYQIFFYDDLDNFIESTEVLSAAYSETVHDGYARIVIMPTNDEDDKIGLTERLTYPGQMTIKVAKEQNIDYVNAFSKRMVCVDHLSLLRFCEGRVMINNGNPYFEDNEDNYVTSKDLLKVEDYSSLSFKYSGLISGQTVTVNIYEFSYLNGDVIYINRLTENSTDGSQTVDFEFSDSTYYVVIQVNIVDSLSAPVKISSSQLDEFYKFFSLVK